MDANGLILHVGDDASLEQFAEAVGAFGALVESVSDAIPKRSPVHWKPDVRKGSIEIVAVPESSDREAVTVVSSAIYRGVEMIASEAQRPAYFSNEALKHVQKLAEQGIGNRIGLNGTTARIDTSVAANVKAYLEAPAHAYGTVEGILQRISSRRGNHCAVYDRRFGYSVECSLNDDMMRKALDSFDQRVVVYGRITYHDRRPYRMSAERLETFPDPNTLPSADDMLGILRDDWVPPDDRR